MFRANNSKPLSSGAALAEIESVSSRSGLHSDKSVDFHTSMKK